MTSPTTPRPTDIPHCAATPVTLTAETAQAIDNRATRSVMHSCAEGESHHAPSTKGRKEEVHTMLVARKISSTGKSWRAMMTRRPLMATPASLNVPRLWQRGSRKKSPDSRPFCRLSMAPWFMVAAKTSTKTDAHESTCACSHNGNTRGQARTQVPRAPTDTDKDTDRLSKLDHDARISTCRVTWMLLEKLEQIQVGVVALRVNEPGPGGQEARKSEQED